MPSLNNDLSSRAQMPPSIALRREKVSVDPMVGSYAPLDDGQMRYGYKIADMGLLVDADTVAEVVPRPSPVRLPRTPVWFCGLTNLRGTLVPMFDLKLLMGVVDKDRGKEDFALIVGDGDEAMGFFIEQYPVGLEALEAVAEQPPLPGLLLPFSGQAYFSSDSIYVELNYPRFFASLSEKLAS